MNRNGHAYVDAICQRNEVLLEPAFVGDALTYYRARVAEARSNAPPRCPELVSIQLTSLAMGGVNAVVQTFEVWRFYSAGNVCTQISYEEQYVAVESGTGFKVAVNDYVQVGAQPCR